MQEIKTIKRVIKIFRDLEKLFNISEISEKYGLLAELLEWVIEKKDKK